jgi:hypothetical protein
VDDLKSKTVLIYDHNSYTWLAERLTRDFSRVLYFSPWQSAFPRRMDGAPGDGLDGVEKVWNFWDVVDEVDLFVFPDCTDADLQDYLRSKGHRVWGSAGGQVLETDRPACRDLQVSLGLDSPPWEIVYGLDALRDRLSAEGDSWVKVSTWRADMETFHHTHPFVTAAFLDVLQEKYGPQAGDVEFVVEDGVPGVEVGYDCHSVDGQHAAEGLVGLEVKDRALVGAVTPFAALPAGLRNVYDALSPFLLAGGCRSYLTLETRLAGDKAYMIDPCLRFGSPCSEAWAEMITNLGEILWAGAAGTLVEAVWAKRFCALAVLNSPWAVRHWTPVDVPEGVKRWVKLKNATRIGGNLYYTPGSAEMAEIGVAVGLGNTLAEAVVEVKRVADEIKGYSITVETDALDEATAAVEEEAAAVGVPFGGGRAEDSNGDVPAGAG